MAKEPKRFHQGIVLKNISDGPNPSDCNPTCNISGHQWVIDTLTSKTATVTAICDSCNTLTSASHGLLTNQHLKVTTVNCAVNTCPACSLALNDKVFVIACGLSCCVFKVSTTRGGSALCIQADSCVCIVLTVIEEQINIYLCSGVEKAATDSNKLSLSNKTLTSPVIDGCLTGTAVLDEDCMCSDSATKLATQQSIKAYIDSQVTAQDLDFTDDCCTACLSIDLDSETLTLAGGTGIGTSGAGNILTIAIDCTVATLTGCQTLTNKTLTSPVFNTSVSGTAIDTCLSCVSCCDDTLASAKAVKAYVDSQVTAQDLDFTDDCCTACLSIDLDSETLKLAGGAGISTSGSGNTLTVAVDCTVATLSGCQTLTNKTIVVVNNTITTAACGNLAATELNAALSELQSDIDTRATSCALTTHICDTTTHGTTGCIVGTSDAQALTNKDVCGGTATNSNRITLPKETTANLCCLTDKEGTVAYDTTQNQPVFNTGCGWSLFASGNTTEPNLLENVGLAASVSCCALTISLKQANGSTDPTAGNPSRIAYTKATEANGGYCIVSTAAALSTVISSGSTGGHSNNAEENLYIYALNNSGTSELAWSSSLFDESEVQSTTAEGGAGGADCAAILYSTTARCCVPIRFLGRLQSTQVTAGTWASAPTIIAQNKTIRYTLGSQQIFTSCGTWTRPKGVLAVEVEVQGGGGAGGGVPASAACEASAGRGGGGGGYSKKFITFGLGATETITIGPGGAGVCAGAGNNGGTSSFGCHISATGGTGGGVGTSVGGIQGEIGAIGGAGACGDIDRNGSRGGNSWYTGNTTGIGIAVAGMGGDSFFGTGGFGETRTGGVGAGQAGVNFGGGGGGAASGTSNNAASIGGAGAGGIIIVKEYY